MHTLRRMACGSVQQLDLLRAGKFLLEAEAELAAECHALAHAALALDRLDSSTRQGLQSPSSVEPAYLQAARALLVPSQRLFAAVARGLSLFSAAEPSSAPALLVSDSAAQQGFTPNTFRRRTSKFWLRAEDLLRVKVAIAQHLPVFDVGASSQVQLARLALHGGVLDPGLVQDWQPGVINSIYYDTAGYGVYMNRLIRDDGAMLVRARLYGDDCKAPGKLFLERKCHRDFWTGEWSYKDREPLTHVRSCSLCSPLYADVNGHRHKGEVTLRTLQDELAAFMARGTLPASAQSPRAVKFFKEVHAFLSANAQGPSVHTRYRRTAYQHASPGSIRVSVDEDVCMRLQHCYNDGDDATSSPPSLQISELQGRCVLEDGCMSAQTYLEDVSGCGKRKKISKSGVVLCACPLFIHSMVSRPSAAIR